MKHVLRWILLVSKHDKTAWGIFLLFRSKYTGSTHLASTVPIRFKDWFWSLTRLDFVLLCHMDPRGALFLVVSFRQDCVPAKRSISWHPFSPWHNSIKLGSAHGLSKALYFLVLVVALVFSCQQVVVNHRKLHLFFRFWGTLPPSKC